MIHSVKHPASACRLRTTLPTRRSSSARLIVVPGKVRVITKFPRLNEMRSQEYRSQ
jgi:hypothetical protein